MISQLRLFLWSCAGATTSLLGQDECETEHSKYSGIGAAVFLTAVLAGVTSSYAFFTVFNSIGWAVAMGSFWALLVFNLDRYIVLSIKKTAVGPNTTLRTRIMGWWKQLLLALPRLALAALLAIAIAKPLELLIFRDEIDLAKRGLMLEQAREFKRDLEAGQAGDSQVSFAGQIKQLEDDNARIEGEIQAKENEKRQTQQDAVDESLGVAGPGRSGQAGEGDTFKIKQEIAANVTKQADAYIAPRRDTLSLNNESIKGLRIKEAQLEQAAGVASEATDGLATRLQAFSRLTARNEVVRYASWVIMAIIMILEIAPILTKLFSAYGPYDRMVEFAEQKVYLTKDQELAELTAALEQRRLAGLKREAVVSDLQLRLISDVKTEPDNARPGSEAQVNWQSAKNTLIEQATFGLTYKSENGDESNRG
jgi:hypothetical protein